MVDNSSMYYTTHFDTVYTNVAPTLPRPVVGPYPYSADEPSRPALNKAGCEQWLLDCVEASEDDGWQHVGRITDMCLFASFRCDDLFAQQWKGASARGQNGEVMERGRHLDDLGETMKTVDVTRLEVEAWQLVMLVSIGWLILWVVHYAINIRLGHQPRRIVQRGVDRDRTSRAASPIGISLPLQLGEVENSSLCYTTQFGTVLMLRQTYHVLLSAHIHTRPVLNEAGCE